MKNKNILPVLLALVLVITASIGSAYAYYTTHAEAKGAYGVHLYHETDIEEDYVDFTKQVRIRVWAWDEYSKPIPVFIRVKGFSGSLYPLEYENVNRGQTGYWITPPKGTQDWCYYSEPVCVPMGDPEKDYVEVPGLDIKIPQHLVTDDDIGTDDLNIAVVYEITPALYDENGEAYADWNYILTDEKAPENPNKGGAA